MACLKQGSELTDFCLKHAQGLKASGHTPTLTSIECLPWMFKSCRDTQRGVRVMSWRQRPVWGEFAVDILLAP